MTEERSNLPAHFGEVAEREARAGLRPLREALLLAREQAGELADAGDVESLAFGYAQLKLLAGDLRSLIDDVEGLIVRETPYKERTRTRDGEEQTFRVYDPFTVEGVGTFEVKRRGATRRWETDELLRRVVAQAIYGDTGEQPSEEARELLDKVLAVLSAVVPFTPSLGWRVTALKAMGIDPDDYSESNRPEGYSLKMTGQKEK